MDKKKKNRKSTPEGVWAGSMGATAGMSAGQNGDIERRQSDWSDENISLSSV